MLFYEPILVIVFYGFGNVDLSVKDDSNQKDFIYTRGLALSFYADEKVEFEHTVSSGKSMKGLVVAKAQKNWNYCK